MFPVPPRPVVYFSLLNIGVVDGAKDGDLSLLLVMLPTYRSVRLNKYHIEHLLPAPPRPKWCVGFSPGCAEDIFVVTERAGWGKRGLCKIVRERPRKRLQSC